MDSGGQGTGSEEGAIDGESSAYRVQCPERELVLTDFFDDSDTEVIVTTALPCCAAHAGNTSGCLRRSS